MTIKADFTSYSRDLFWKIWDTKNNEFIRWSGYDDAFWWDTVSKRASFQIKRTSDGRAFILNPEKCEVEEMVTPQHENIVSS